MSISCFGVRYALTVGREKPVAVFAGLVNIYLPFRERAANYGLQGGILYFSLLSIAITLFTPFIAACDDEYICDVAIST